MPEFIPRTPAPANNVRFFNWPGAGEQISETLEMTHAAVIPPGVSTIHVGGQVGLTPQGTVPADLEEEIKEAFEHIELSLRAAGLTGTKQEVWAYVYKVRTFHANTDERFGGVLHRVMIEHFGANRPTFTGVDVYKMLRPDLHVEVEVEAFLPKAS